MYSNSSLQSLTYNNKVNASASFYGICISIFCFGAFVTSPFLGKWADKRPVRESLLVSGILSLVGKNYDNNCLLR